MVNKRDSFFKLIILLFVIIIFNSCENDDKDYIYLSDELRISATADDKTVALSWTLTQINDFHEYRVYRSLNRQDYNSSSFWQSGELIYRTTDFYEQSFTDLTPSVLGVNYYWIESYSNGNYVKSNLDSVRISNYTSFNFFPKGVVHNAFNNVIGFIDNERNFILYNYEQDRVIGKTSVNYSFQHPSIGTYNRQAELYLSNEDGICDIYDAATFEKKESVRIMSSGRIYSITSNNSGILYFSRYGGNEIYKYDRSTGKINITSTSWDELYLCYDSDLNKLVAIENDSYPKVYTYILNSNGTILSSDNTSLSGYYYPILKKGNGNVYSLPSVKSISIESTEINNSDIAKNVNDILEVGDAFYIAKKNTNIIQKQSTTSLLAKYEVPGCPIYLFKNGQKMVVLFIDPNISSTSDEYSNRPTKGYNSDIPFGITFIDL